MMNSQNDVTNILNTPALPEVKLHIMSFLNKRDFASIGATCREMRTLSLDKTLNPFSYTTNPKNWKKFIGRDSIRLFSSDSQFAMTSDNKLLMSNPHDFGTISPVIEINDLNQPISYHTVRTLTGHAAKITSIVELSPGLLASCSMNASIRIWDLSQPPGKECISRVDIPRYGVYSGGWMPRTFEVRDPATCLISFKNNKLVSKTQRSCIFLWDLSDLDDLSDSYSYISGNCSLITKLSDTEIAWADTNGRIFICDIQTYQKGYHAFDGFDPKQGPLSMLVSLPNRHLATVKAGNSSTVKIWDCHDGNHQKCIFKINAQDLGYKKITVLGYIPYGKIITAVEDELIIWDLTSKQHGLFSTFPTPTYLLNFKTGPEIHLYNRRVFPPDGHYYTKKVKIHSEVGYIATLNDGRFLTLSKDGQVHLFSYAPKPEIEDKANPLPCIKAK